MNSVVRQLLEQDTDVVMVDTGDSYEGICSSLHGTYITYSKESPISMNPFKVTHEEYEKKFGPLMTCDEGGNRYAWISDPWPWNVMED